MTETNNDSTMAASDEAKSLLQQLVTLSIDDEDPVVKSSAAHNLKIMNRIYMRRPLMIKPIVVSHLEKFELFRALPLELRLKIWKFALIPRLLTLEDRNDFHGDLDMELVEPAPSARRSTVPLLSTCQESRQGFLKDYLYDSPNGGPDFFLNHSIDTVHIHFERLNVEGPVLSPHARMHKVFPQKDLNNIQNMVIEVREGFLPWCTDFYAFKALRQVTITRNSYEKTYFWDPHYNGRYNRHHKWKNYHMAVSNTWRANPELRVDFANKSLSDAEFGEKTTCAMNKVTKKRTIRAFEKIKEAHPEWIEPILDLGFMYRYKDMVERPASLLDGLGNSLDGDEDLNWDAIMPGSID